VHVTELQHLLELTDAVGRAAGTDEIFQVAIRALRASLRVDRASVLLFDEQGVMRFRAWEGLSEDYRGQTDGHSPWTPDARNPEPVLVPNVHDDPSLGELREVIVGEGIAALAFVPLVNRDRLLGKFMLYYDQPHAFTSDEVRLAQIIAAQIALVIERTRSEDELRRSRDQLAVILRSIADGVTVQAPEGHLLYANEAAAELVGYDSAQQLVETPVTDVVRAFEVLDQDGRPLAIERFPGRRALAGEDVAPMAIRFRVKTSGEERWSMVSATPVFDAQGRVSFAINVFHDVTAEKRSERRLRFLAEAGAQLALSLDAEIILQGVARLAVTSLADWAIAFQVDEALAIQQRAIAHAQPEREAVAAELQRRYPIEQEDSSLLWSVLRDGQPRLVTEVTDDLLQRTTRDPEHLRLMRELGVVSAIWLPLIAHGRTLGAIGLFTAESRWRYTPDDLALAEEVARRAALALDNARLYDQAQEAIRSRDQFLSVASHELKTPVAGIRTAAQMLRRAQSRGLLDAERLDRSLRLVDTTAERLGQLTDDLLDVSRLRLGQLELRLELLDLSALVGEVTGRYRDQLDECHQLAQRLPDAPCPVLGDRPRLEQVLANLLDNAIKYSPRGGEIAVELQPNRDGFMICVADQGIGLPPDSLAEIFEPFSRAPNAAREGVPGLGLGLHICQNILERHGGWIRAESDGEGHGSTFSFWLPRLADNR
jgi:PAS domain S-box-containing protein